MTNEEQKAFVEAYGKNVAMISEKHVADFISRYFSGDDVEYENDYANIVDALLMWNEGIKWQMQQSKKALP